MSLNWNVEQVVNHEQVCFIETDEKDSEGKPLRRMNPVTDALIWATISIKLGEITEANADDFYARLAIMEKLSGPFLVDGEGNSRYITPEEVKAHIGLYCNVANEQPVKFFASIRQHDYAQLKATYKSVTQNAPAR
jgi:hypothetical protein